MEFEDCPLGMIAHTILNAYSQEAVMTRLRRWLARRSRLHLLQLCQCVPGRPDFSQEGVPAEEVQALPERDVLAAFAVYCGAGDEVSAMSAEQRQAIVAAVAGLADGSMQWPA